MELLLGLKFLLLSHILLFSIVGPKSTKGINRISKIERNAMQISEDVMSAITGMMLSDGHIAQPSASGTVGVGSITGNARFIVCAIR